MRGIEGEQVLLRIMLSESRTHEGTPLHRRILEFLRAEGLAGTTVLKGMAGFGHDRAVHTVMLEVAAQGLPIVLEVVDTPAHVERILPTLETLMAGGGVIMTERAHVIRYAQSPSSGPPP